ncbi:hypothetical protein BCIN_11g05400 [Botrytis cinerea B05.10]|uniref:Methyltransferase type 11 domain-containing protein n=1 Tax=Botryotinia fuckeliana (strain B05.10) TaxID=332648 RepID=A0A384JXK5_BOTFB|nr:hypothetical protein BCIN_11g05400 [Botrytis cinerea B05.10]ATZ55268.1 hypothetical protein BCIN_11g05400 [Botrytis cinerea B05.10]
MVRLYYTIKYNIRYTILQYLNTLYRTIPHQKTEAKFHKMADLMKELGSQTKWSTSEFTSCITKMSEAKGLQPGTLPIRHMVQLAHDLLPFDSADCKDKIILDVGCGPGQVTEHLLEEYRPSLFPVSGDHHNNHNHKAHILASDFSAPMIAQLTSRKEKEIAKGNGIWECVDAKVCDAQDLRMIVRDRVASHVFASLVLFMLPEPRQGLSEMKRVLGRGGVAACTSWRGSEWIDLMRVGAASASASAEGKQEEEEEIGAGDEEKVKGKGKGKMEIPKEWSSAEGGGERGALGL